MRTNRLRARFRKVRERRVGDLDYDTDAFISKLIDEIREESDKALHASKVKVATGRKPVKKIATQSKRVAKGTKK